MGSYQRILKTSTWRIKSCIVIRLCHGYYREEQSDQNYMHWNLKEANKFPYSAHCTTKFNIFSFGKASSLCLKLPKVTSSHTAARNKRKLICIALFDVTSGKIVKNKQMKSQKSCSVTT